MEKHDPTVCPRSVPHQRAKGLSYNEHTGLIKEPPIEGQFLEITPSLKTLIFCGTLQCFVHGCFFVLPVQCSDPRSFLDLAFCRNHFGRRG